MIYRSIFYTSWIWVFCQIRTVWCVRFHTFNVSFDEQMWILIKFKFSSFSFMVNALCLRNLCLRQGHEDILCFLLKELLLLPFIFKPMICLELIFVCGLRWGRSRFIYFSIQIPSWPSTHPVLKKNFSFSPPLECCCLHFNFWIPSLSLFFFHSEHIDEIKLK